MSTQRYFWRKNKKEYILITPFIYRYAYLVKNKQIQKICPPPFKNPQKIPIMYKVW